MTRTVLTPYRVSATLDGRRASATDVWEGRDPGDVPDVTGLPSGLCIQRDGLRCADGGFVEQVVEVELAPPAEAGAP